MQLTMFEQISQMKRACQIHGCSLTELKQLLSSKNKADSAKADAIAKTLSKLKSMQMAKKVEARSDKESKTLAKALSAKLSPLDEFIAQSKRPSEAKKSSWIKAAFSRKRISEAEAIALLSQSCISLMNEIDPYQVEKARLHNDEITKRAAFTFCKRFGLTQ